jgi:chemotaxis protein methyltransferase CheR
LERDIPIEDALKYVSFTGKPVCVAGPHFNKVKNPSPIAEDDLLNQSEKSSQLISDLLKRAGLNPGCYRNKALYRRLPACLRSLHADSEACALQILEREPELLAVAMDALLIGVTEFFRDSTIFETLRTEILPQLEAQGRPLRVWSAGCSNGAELYSVAILLAQTGMLDGCYLLGTDCRFDAIQRARNAIYDLNQLRNIQSPDQAIYFTNAGRNYRPIGLLCRNVHWHVADLLQGIEQGPWDLILWRNMAIYLTAEAAEPVWYGLASSLAPGGALIVGRAERPPAALPLVNQKRCVYRIRSGFQPERKVQETSI